MVMFPQSIYTPRTKENRTGVVYDASKTKIIFVEDITKLDDEVVAVEESFKKQVLTGVSYPNGFFENLQIGDTDVYTVPTGKKAYIGGNVRYFNNSGGNITAFLQYNFVGNLYKISKNNTIAGGASSDLTDFKGILLNEDDILTVNVATNNGLNVALNIIEFEDTTPLYRRASFGISAGDNVIFTVSSGKTAYVFSGIHSDGFVQALNDSGATDTLNFYTVASGGTPSGNNQRCPAQTLLYGDNFVDSFPETLPDGTQFIVNALNGGADNIWLTIWEI